MSFDDALRAALRREPAPADFAAKVLARAAPEPKAAAIPIRRRPIAWAIAAGLTIAALVPTGVSEYRRRREARALEARRELMVALAVTRVKLQQTREKLQRSARHPL
jgi:hypothetical protein